jgi:hypothetical protein
MKTCPYVPMDTDGNRSQMSNPGPSYAWGTIDQRGLDVITYWLKHKYGGDFLTVDGWALNNDKEMKTDLPIWWSEWYVDDPPSHMAPWITTTLYSQQPLQAC